MVESRKASALLAYDSERNPQAEHSSARNVPILNAIYSRAPSRRSKERP